MLDTIMKIFNALKLQIKKRSYKSSNIYGDGQSASKIIKILKKLKIDTQK